MSDWRVAPEDAGLRLDKFLAAADRLGSRPRASAALERGKVFLNGVEATPADAGRRLAADEIVRVWADRPGSARRRVNARAGDLDILYEDGAIIVVNKPAGLLTVPLERRAEAASVLGMLREQMRKGDRWRPLVVHRIDRDTSGVVLFAKDPRAQAQLKERFRRHEPERVYWAIVYGRPNPPEGTWRDHLVWDQNALIQKETHPKDPRAAEAVADYRVLESFRDTSLIEVRLQTGKRNQIRLQARLRGHMLIGEQRYVYGPDSLRTVSFARQALHARRLQFRHPETDKTMDFVAPLPKDMEDLLARLRKSGREERPPDDAD